MAQSSELVSLSEAARICGLSPRTLRGLEKEGRLPFHRSPGGHVRIARVDLDGLLRHPSNASSVSSSSVLAAKKEEVESLGLELQAERGRRELAKLHEQDAEVERERKETRRAGSLENKRVLAEIDLQRRRDTDRRQREQREAEAQRCQEEFERRWVRWATARLFDWLTFEQRQTVLRAIEETVSSHQTEDEEIMERTLVDVISRICVPWEFERRARAKRENLIDQSLRKLPYDATEIEKVRAAADVRAALSLVPLDAGELEIRAVVSAALDPVIKAIDERKASEDAKARQKRANEEAESEKTRRRQARNFHKSLFVAAGVARVDVYLSELYADNEIDLDTYSDSVWRGGLKDLVREELEATLTGADDETCADAEQIAEEFVDEELE
jgi:excisionase family DNA binding protein